jgi:Zn-dependent membrane protease YugP
MVELFLAWWPYLLLAYLPSFVNLLTTLVYEIVKSRLDHAIPDEMPSTAGEWLKQELIAAGLHVNVRALVADQPESSNAYRDREGIIQLTEGTWFKSDPTYWAVAAHELGHARFRVGHPFLSLIFAPARTIGPLAVAVAFALIGGNILYGLPGVTDLGFQLLTAGVIGNLLVVFDEMIASAFAGRFLRRAPAVAPRHFRAARIVLFAALCTYLGSFVAHALLVAQWDAVVALTGSGVLGEPAGAATGWRQALIAAATGLGVVYAVSRLVAAFASGIAARFAGRRQWLVLGFKLLWQAALVLLIALLWDARADLAYQRSVLLALLPALKAFSLLIGFPVGILFIITLHLRTRLLFRFAGQESSAIFHDSLRAGADTVRDGNRTLAASLARRIQSPSAYVRVRQLVELLYLPLLYNYWVS